MAQKSVLLRSQFWAFYLSVILLAVGIVQRMPLLWVPALFFVLVGIYDLVQTKRSILRNYPITAHIRFFLEGFRNEIRQYFIESDTEEVPFSRNQRAIVYQRAKGALATRPFGTKLNVYEDEYQWFNHSNYPSENVGSIMGRATVGSGEHRYDVSPLNISAMSFGAISANAVMALNKGAATEGFYHDTGEGGISPYHETHGGDLVMQLGTSYFGCRTEDGHLDDEKFANLAAKPNVKMIEIKMSQGAKPAHGGVLPASKVNEEIAKIRDIPVGVTCISPPSHSEFSNSEECMQFVERLRRLAKGKPVGIKMAIGREEEFCQLVQAMLSTNIYPDFIVIDGAEGGTGAAPLEFESRLGMPMIDALRFAHGVMVGAGVRSQVKLGAAGKIINAFDIARAMALGADWCNSARGFMFSIGCIQSLSCNTNACPTGVATQDPIRQRALVVEDKSERVASFHHETLHALEEFVAAMGVRDRKNLNASLLMIRTSEKEVVTAAEYWPIPKDGELLFGTGPERYVQLWQKAQQKLA